MSAREWMRICFELLELLKAHKKAIRRATVNTFGYIAKAIGWVLCSKISSASSWKHPFVFTLIVCVQGIGSLTYSPHDNSNHSPFISKHHINQYSAQLFPLSPHDVLATLLNNLKVQERQNRVCTTVAIAIVAETCSPFTVLPALMNEYRVPELNVQNGVLKSLSFLFEYIGEMGKDYIYAVTPLLEDALMDRWVGRLVFLYPQFLHCTLILTKVLTEFVNISPDFDSAFLKKKSWSLL